MSPLFPAALCLAFLMGSPSLAEAAALTPELEQRVAAAEAAGLPASVLESKALEGLAKGVPAPRIAAVLDTMSADLAQVAGILGPLAEGGDRAELLSAALSAHLTGLSDASLRLLADQDPALRGRAVHAVADLLRLGFGERDAVELVQAAASSDDPLTSLGGLATAASLLVSNGMDPGAAAARLASESKSSKHPLANVPPQSRSDLPEPAQDAPGWGPGGKPK